VGLNGVGLFEVSSKAALFSHKVKITKPFVLLPKAGITVLKLTKLPTTTPLTAVTPKAALSTSPAFARSYKPTAVLLFPLKAFGELNP
jgi:hypothetical protein